MPNNHPTQQVEDLDFVSAKVILGQLAEDGFPLADKMLEQLVMSEGSDNDLLEAIKDYITGARATLDVSVSEDILAAREGLELAELKHMLDTGVVDVNSLALWAEAGKQGSVEMFKLLMSYDGMDLSRSASSPILVAMEQANNSNHIEAMQFLATACLVGGIPSEADIAAAPTDDFIAAMAPLRSGATWSSSASLAEGDYDDALTISGDSTSAEDSD